MGYVLVLPWQIEHPHRSRLELRIPCLAIIVNISYSLFSSCGILTSIIDVLSSLVGGMGRYPDIAQ